ncbi:hypothetical protein BDV26DRAFT_287935 [Aspergillus bertholletiae]|uniref:Zn(2)-C6 fungal-type domain-containing protein n=1 Tax=Aspergillus bertholletiae TaxID=1226010 RepID=A0A5N7BMY8_9EURO|nr:hypothetical protein BDV26DRAFT_287935 [Aspergillus bertholletiae]
MHAASVQMPPVNRRSKPQLSCMLCRRRKLRCDRKRPCSACTSRGLALSCGYPNNDTPQSPAVTTIAQPRPAPRPPVTHNDRPRATIQDRLGQLEQIVVSLMQKTTGEGQDHLGHHPVPGSASRDRQNEGEVVTGEHSPAQSDGGSIWFNSSDVQYVGGTHWAAILDGIADLKQQLAGEDETEVEKPTMLHTFLLYGCKSASKDDILEALPDKAATDRYVSRYFNRLDLAPSCIHSGQFLREYEHFWEKPSQTGVMWIGLLFSMICLAELASSATGYGAPTGNRNPLVDTYREKIVQCLLLGEYTKSGKYTFETLYHYLTIEYSIRKDADRDIWILSGISVNIALRMGYHRDPSHLPGISPFAAEMRRRAWATILQGDILISTQMGMPRMIKDWQCDTVEPRNLNDSDFDEDCTELPPSRPETEITTVSHLIARRRIFIALGAIVDLTASVRPVAYDEAMRLDQALHDAEATVPPYLRMKPMASAVTDPPQVILHRLFLRLMFHKGQIMLHCKYLNPDPDPSSDKRTLYSYSRSSCIEAALGILEIQRIFDEETSPDGQLYTMRWRESSVMKHEFLTATMLLCFLARQKQDDSVPPTEAYTWDQIMEALALAHKIWSRSSSSSVEAKTAADTINIVLVTLSGNTKLDSKRPAMNSDITIESAQTMSLATEGLNQYNLQESFYYGLPFMGSSQIFPGPFMMEPNLAPQWQPCLETGLPQDPV